MSEGCTLPPPPLLTATLPGCGGRLRAVPEDFAVEEIPAYEPCGTGEHLYLWIEKRGVGAEFFLKRLARLLGISDRDIGMAGMKDRHAVTRQWVSVPAAAEARLGAIDGEGITLLQVSRHGNKLRTGHLRGNRFRILIRDARPDAPVEEILNVIREQGLPNYYGPQRFGRDGETARQGLRLLAGERKRLPPFQLKLALSAAQSVLFNDVLAARQQDGLLSRVLAGDVLMKWPAGGMFTVDDAAREQPRLDAREVVPGGPMFGRKLFAAHAEAAEREAQALARHGLTVQSFHGFGQLLPGTRRHMIVYLEDLNAAREAEGWRLAFTLPAGSYATVLLREVMKDDAADAEQ